MKRSFSPHKRIYYPEKQKLLAIKSQGAFVVSQTKLQVYSFIEIEQATYFGPNSLGTLKLLRLKSSEFLEDSGNVLIVGFATLSIIGKV